MSVYLLARDQIQLSVACQLTPQSRACNRESDSSARLVVASVIDICDDFNDTTAIR